MLRVDVDLVDYLFLSVRDVEEFTDRTTSVILMWNFVLLSHALFSDGAFSLSYLAPHVDTKAG